MKKDDAIGTIEFIQGNVVEFFPLILLFASSVPLLTTILNVVLWPRITREGAPEENAVSILIPARNEAKNITACLDTVVQQHGIREVLIYDDHSIDETAHLVQRYAQRHPIVRLLSTVDLPAGWTGKNFACAQLAANAKGEWLLFVDADVRFRADAIPRILQQAKRAEATILSCWPALELHSFWEKALMPLLNFFVYSIYPAPVALTNMMPSLGIAHGACMLIQSDVYRSIGGHAKVRERIFEDTELARLWRAEGERSLCFDGQDVVSVRMYDSLRGIWQGFQKNLYPGFRSDFSFFLFLLFHTLVFLLPFFFLFVSKTFLTLAAVVWLIRILLALRFRHPLWSALLHPLTEIMLIALALSSWWKCKTGHGVAWKGRTYFATKRQ